MFCADMIEQRPIHQRVLLLSGLDRGIYTGFRKMAVAGLWL